MLDHLEALYNSITKINQLQILIISKTISQEKNKMTIVLIAVAKLESVFFIPILASIAVIAAKNAEPKAHKIHTKYSFFQNHYIIESIHSFTCSISFLFGCFNASSKFFILTSKFLSSGCSFISCSYLLLIPIGIFP